MHLTARQKDLYDFIVRYEDAHGVVPSYDEMMEGCGLASKSGVHRLVVSLEERNYIARLPNRARAIEVLKPSVAGIGRVSEAGSLLSKVEAQLKREQKRSRNAHKFIRDAGLWGQFQSMTERTTRVPHEGEVE